MAFAQQVKDKPWIPKVQRQYYSVFAPNGGLRYDLPSTMLEDQYTPRCEEIRLEDGVVRKQKGTAGFAGTVASPLNGTVMALSYINGACRCHTTTKVYLLSAGAFVDKTNDAMTGDEDNAYSWAFITNIYIFTNGKDQIQQMASDGTVSDLGGAGTYLPFWILYYGGRLCMYNVLDGGVDCSKRVRWSELEKPEDYDSDKGAGLTDLYSMLRDDDEIVRAERLGSDIIIYGDHSMARQTYDGAYFKAPYGFRAAIPDTGLSASRALVSIEGKRHIFMGWDDIYIYEGLSDVHAIGGPIRDELFNIIAPTYINRSFMVHIPAENKMRLFIATTGNTTPDTYFEYDLEAGHWTRGTRSYTGWGPYKEASAITWGDLVDTWGDQAWEWGDQTLYALADSQLYGSGSVVYKDDGTAKSLAGTAIDCFYETKDFVTGEGYRRTLTHWMELNFEAKGTTVDVSYSTDEGVNWTTLETTTLTSDWAKYNIDFTVDEPVIRLRWRNEEDDGLFELRWFEVGYLEATDGGVA